MRSPAKSPPKSPTLQSVLAANVTTANPNEGTQLAEPAPQLDLPQRIDAPESIKTPQRLYAATRDERLRKTIFSPHAVAQQKLRHELRMSYSNGEELAAQIACCSAQKLMTADNAVSAKLIKEYTMLAESSKRAGRHDAECTAHLCLGILYDNVEDYAKAIDCYLLVLSISESTQQKLFTALAANCIGVDYQLMSSATKEFAYTGGFVDPANRLLQSALIFHQKHLEAADDAGKFVAHLNLGLTHGSLGEPNDAARHHQEALRLSIRLNSSYGQALAVGNLGLLASRQNDIETATACMDQHLQLIQSVGDRSAEAIAWIYLGHLASRVGKHDKAVRSFDQAYKIALELGEAGTLKLCSCYLGVARAHLQMEAYVQQLTAKFVPPPLSSNT